VSLARVARTFLALALAVGAADARQKFSDFTTPLPLQPGATLVLGFLGGWEPWNNPKRAVRKLALKLRERELPNLYIETVENHRRRLAHELVRAALDADGNGRLDEAERAVARIVLYGQSFGGAAVVKMARELNVDGIPVLLTVQVDSVGRGDEVIPPNVAAAVNFYQRESWPVIGQKSIRAADSSRTQILENVKFSYRDKQIDLSSERRLRRILSREHIKMEHDPEVWSRVESLVLSRHAVRSD
jgi:dienelactone hydrolase